MEKHSWLWGVGIENTFVTQTERGERELDEYELTQHYEFWQEDIDRAIRIGAEVIRYGIPWHRVEPSEGVFDWSWVDTVMDYFRQYPQITPIIDLMHYGTPRWLKNEFLHGEYPHYVARYAHEFASRYKDIITYYTPLNEPFVNAEFCGWNGTWPPYLEGISGFYRLILQLGKGMIFTVQSILSVQPEARFVYVDATKRFITYDPMLQPEAKLWEENSMVMWELLQGRIGKDHPLYSFMLQYGVEPESLAWFSRHAIELDIVGVNYYPQFSVHEVCRDEHGRMHTPHIAGTGEHLITIMQRFYERYQKPIMITETSYRGSENERIKWLQDCYQSCMQAKEAGIDLRGIIWFPFMDLVDWGYRTSGKSVEEELHPFGLYTLEMKAGVLYRRKNRVAEAFEQLIAQHCSTRDKDDRTSNG